MIKPLNQLPLLALLSIILTVTFLPSCDASGMIWPVEPLRLSISEYGSTSAFTLSIRVETETPANKYVRLTLANYTSITPKACYFGLYGRTLSDVYCGVIPGATDPFIQNPIVLRPTESYSLLVQLEDRNPLKVMSGIFQVS